MTARYVGQPMRRAEDVRFLSGKGQFIDDFKLEGLAHAVIARSPHAHARLGAIDAGAALALPGVLAVLTFADIAADSGEIPIRLGPLPGFERFLQQPLARDKVRYVGEPVAVVVAENRYIAEDALDLLAVDYEPLDVVADMDAASADTILIHDGPGTNCGSRYRVERGDVATAFAGADYTRKERFRCHRHAAVPLETRGLVAQYDATADRLMVWGAAKVSFFNRRHLAEMLRMPESAIELIEFDVGGSFGVRGEFYPEDFLVPWAARYLRRPVKWIEDRREHLIATNHSREVECELEIALRRDGTILGLRADLRADMGAYVRTNGGVVPSKAAQFLPGPYRIANFSCDVAALMTNKTPVGTYRGPGRYEANFFRERLIDLAAADLGLSPVEIRLRNLITSAELPYDLGRLVPTEAPTAYDTGDYVAAFHRALDAIGYDKLSALQGQMRDGKRHGIGLACFVESSGAGPAESARLVVESGRQVAIYTGCSTMGQGHETVLAQICADELGLAIETFTVFHGSTSHVEQGYGTYHSRAIVVGGSAVKLAASKLAEQVVAYAAHALGTAPASLEFRDGAVFRRGDNLGTPLLDLDQLAAAARDGDERAAAALRSAATFEVSQRTYTYGTHVAHVAVDVETAAVELIRYITVEDIGRAVNPLLVHGQAIGAAVQGIGAAFLDELVYDRDGQLLTGSFADYLLPTSTDFPNVEAITLEDFPSKLNPLGVKGAGEGGIVATGAAIANAVGQALAPLGVRLNELPLSLDNLARWIRESRRQPG